MNIVEDEIEPEARDLSLEPSGDYEARLFFIRSECNERAWRECQEFERGQVRRRVPEGVIDELAWIDDL